MGNRKQERRCLLSKISKIHWCFQSNSLVGQMVKNLSAMQETRFYPCVGKISWRRKWQPTPVFLPGKSHGWRSLVGYSSWGRKELEAFDCVDHNKLWKILKEMRIPDHLTCLLRNLYAGQEAAVRTGHGTTEWFK